MAKAADFSLTNVLGKKADEPLLEQVVKVRRMGAHRAAAPTACMHAAAWLCIHPETQADHSPTTQRPSPPTLAAAKLHAGGQADWQRRLWRHPPRRDHPPQPGLLLNYMQVDKQIGKGAFGVVFLGNSRTSGEAVAVKSISKAKLVCKEDVKDVQGEVAIMNHVSGHKHVVTLRVWMGGGDAWG